MYLVNKMSTPIRITVIRHEAPDLKRLAKALIALAEWEQAQKRQPKPKESDA